METKKEILQSSVKTDEITVIRFVCYIDIMGFKDMVSRKTSKEIYDNMKKLRNSMSKKASLLKSSRDTFNFINFSDSIVIFSKNDNDSTFYYFAHYISAVLTDLFVSKIPFRGSIAYGKMTVDIENSIYFGQPLIDAYLLGEQLQYYGVVFHASAEKKITELYRDSNERVNVIQKYNCKFKEGEASHLTIFPLLLIKELNGKKFDKRDEYYKNYLANLNNLKFETSGHLRKYIENTESYLKYIYSAGDLNWDEYIKSFNQNFYLEN